jgi:hypothetical protein
MKHITKLAVIGALIGLGAAQANAQTNATLNVNISLTGVKQTGDGTTAPVHISTKDVIQAAAPGASAKAKLLLLFSIPDGNPGFVVRDGVGAAATDTPIDAGVLALAQVGTQVNSTKTNASGVVVEKDVAIREFVFNSTSSGTFDVQGYITATSDNKLLHGGLSDGTTPTQASGQVAGTGTDATGNAAVLKGTVSLSARKIVEIP